MLSGINIKETAVPVTWSAHHLRQFAFSASAEYNIRPTAATAISLTIGDTLHRLHPLRKYISVTSTTFYEKTLNLVGRHNQQKVNEQ